MISNTVKVMTLTVIVDAVIEAYGASVCNIQTLLPGTPAFVHVQTGDSTSDIVAQITPIHPTPVTSPDRTVELYRDPIVYSVAYLTLAAYEAKSGPFLTRRFTDLDAVVRDVKGMLLPIRPVNTGQGQAEARYVSNHHDDLPQVDIDGEPVPTGPDFWAVVKAQLGELETAQSADDVLRILSPERDPYGPGHNTGGEGFFAGSGGDDTVQEALEEAGWTVVWQSPKAGESHIYYVMQAPNGDKITYIEGDIERGDTHKENGS